MMPQTFLDYSLRKLLDYMESLKQLYLTEIQIFCLKFGGYYGTGVEQSLILAQHAILSQMAKLRWLIDHWGVCLEPCLERIANNGIHVCPR